MWNNVSESPMIYSAFPYDTFKGCLRPGSLLMSSILVSLLCRGRPEGELWMRG